MTIRMASKRRAVALAATGASLALILSACADTDDGGGGGGEETAGAFEVDCAPYEEFGDLEGTTVSVYTTIVEPEAETQVDSYKPFEECTGVKVEYEASREMEAQLPVRVQAGNPPDIAILPAAGPAADAGASVRRRPPRSRAGRGQHRRGLGSRVEGVRHRRRHVLRGAAGLQREVVRLVLAVQCSRRRATRSRRPGTSMMALTQEIADSGAHRRGARASSPVTPPAGRSPTGSRTSMLRTARPRRVRPVGTPTRSRSTTRRSSRRGTRRSRHLENPDYVQRWPRAGSTRSRRRPWTDAGLPILEGYVLDAPCQRNFYADATGPRAPR